MTLYNEIAKEMKGFEKVLGVSVKHLGTGEEVSINGEERFPTASVFKVPVIVELYRQAEAGGLSFDSKMVLKDSLKVPGSGILKELSEGLEVTVRDLSRLMMILSDNTATDMIVERVGKENVNATMQRFGLKNTVVLADCRDMLFDLVGGNSLPDGEKTLDLYLRLAKAGTDKGSWSLGTERNDVTTPLEMNRLLEFIVDGKAAGRASCDSILATMEKCQTGEHRVPKYLPAEKVKMQRKTGSLPGIRNDVGVITILATGERYCISCFTKDASDVYAAEEAIARVSRNVYQHFTGGK
ncbi:MAG: class A beta-lactamase-related serine hydrolase [Candidatus Bathyarchaeota archaeon]|nr:class A beta-lactamase-related serine hydrolase [Candidatus Bathyarchaeota archaeon]